MKLVKESSIIELEQDSFNNLRGYIREMDKDVENLFLFAQNRVRFGDGSDGNSGENISGLFKQVTSDAVPGTEFNLAHTLGSIPKGRIIMWQDKPGHLSQGPGTGTAWTSSQVSFTCDSATVTFSIFLVK